MQPGPGVLMPGMQSPGMPVGAWALGMAVPGAGVMAEQYHVQGGQNMQVPSDMNDRDVRMLKRKQANRDSARRSKQKKKQEIADLTRRKSQVAGSNKELAEKVTKALATVRQLQSANVSLREQYESIVKNSGQQN
uniref:BZIP domain-containing protein n=1 Tax=Chlamydomonas euryale TaxID=1486919 RepID=A0A7R9VFF9_9CHLO|mmetsp:Transcript_33966/g.101089  ORF Transcript_33966/g.101089 Transcript_33966/m.101089 type:complete len:135 (+) Transcript_33966:262-666(+)